jgi:hypothetical protein
MLENIKDYILVKNYIPAEVCESTINDISVNNAWEKHLWQNYGVVRERPTFPPTELDVAESTPDQNQLLYPYLGEALKQYEEHIKSNNSFDGFVSNCGLHIACPVRFNRYTSHTLMKAHHDHIHSLFDGERKGIPTLSIVGLLNDDYEGGNFVFFKDYEIKLKAGDILIFPSVFMFPHRVDKVSKGIRHSFVSWAW